MPLVDSNQASLWDGGEGSLYRCHGENGVLLGYARAAKQQYYGNDIDSLIAGLVPLGLVKGQRIALVGAGFGWAAERFNELGYGPIADGTSAGRIVSVDTSTWIQANKTGNAVVPILNSDVNNATGRRALRQALGSNNQTIDWAISEDVLPILTDNETQPFADSMRQLATNVVHWVTVGTRVWNDPNTWAGDPRLNWKTLADWKVLMTPDLVARRGPLEVL